MVYRGIPSKACARCRIRRAKVSLGVPAWERNTDTHPSAIFIPARVVNAVERVHLAPDTGTPRVFGFGTKATLLFENYRRLLHINPNRSISTYQSMRAPAPPSSTTTSPRSAGIFWSDITILWTRQSTWPLQLKLLAWRIFGTRPTKARSKRR